jgi:hypothetical protein
MEKGTLQLEVYNKSRYASSTRTSSKWLGMDKDLGDVPI